ncbi:competence type IV pilus minor pilin ComGD [Halobacillus rhizosphaerae]|uniref:competence type IV pilus minor pilin ComGD n=1 Tax=Halobacillus rhizosphaerae TaxID=3064889 RepID=UPI00398A964E
MNRSHRNYNGFSLAEVLLVLLAWSVLLLCIAPFHSQAVINMERKEYIRQLESDVLLAQQLTMENHPYYLLYIRPELKEYYLYDYKQKEVVYERKFPKNWRIDMLTLTSPIQFTADGTIKKPGTMLIYTKDQNYRVVFPFGKSRVNIIEQ